jgi:hypothetical protein
MSLKIETKPNLHNLTSGLHALMNTTKVEPFDNTSVPSVNYIQATDGLPVFQGGAIETRSMKRPHVTRAQSKKFNIKLKEGLPPVKRKKRKNQSPPLLEVVVDSLNQITNVVNENLLPSPPSPVNEPLPPSPINEPSPSSPVTEEDEENEMLLKEIHHYPEQLRPWIKKIKETQRDNPHLNYKDVLRLAKENYSAKPPRISNQKYTPRRRKAFFSEETATRIFRECYMNRYGVTKAELRTPEAKNKKSSLNKNLRLLSRAMRMNMLKSRSKKNTVYFDKSKQFRCTRRKGTPVLSRDFKYISSEIKKCDPLYIRPLGRFTPRNISKPAEEYCQEQQQS